MKKLFTITLLMLALAVPAIHAEEEPVVAAADDSIAVRYVPNAFKDNWELSVQGGVTASFLGFRPVEVGAKPNMTIGGGGEITATKWFNPYFGGRFGWQAEYGQSPDAENLFNNYFHMDMLWDWSNQFGGLNERRIYHAVPYLHAGVFYNPQHNARMAGGAGLLNRFRVGDHVYVNLDIRGNITSASKFGTKDGSMLGGIAGLVSAMVGVSYRFNEASWNKTAKGQTRSAARLAELEKDYAALKEANKQLAEDNKQLQTETVTNTLYQLVDSAFIDSIKAEFGSDELAQVKEMTVYFGSGSSSLSAIEKAHLRTYLMVIRIADPKAQIRYSVVGRADTATGTEEVNNRVATARAEAIRQELISAGVAEDMITTSVELVNTGNRQLDRAASIVFEKVQK